jgi:hypothetical protein
VREFYRENHRYQTYDFVQQKRTEFLGWFVPARVVSRSGISARHRVSVSFSQRAWAPPRAPYALRATAFGLAARYAGGLDDGGTSPFSRK